MCTVCLNTNTFSAHFRVFLDTLIECSVIAEWGKNKSKDFLCLVTKQNLLHFDTSSFLDRYFSSDLIHPDKVQKKTFNKIIQFQK